MNKEDLINEIRECRFGVNESITDIDELWVWINQNYISREQILNLECLKEENFLLEMSKLRVVIDNEHWNYAIKFLKDTIEVRNQLRKEIKEEIEKL